MVIVDTIKLKILGGAAAALLLALLAGGAWHFVRVAELQAEVSTGRAEFAEYRGQVDRQRADLESEYRSREAELQAAADKDRKTYEAQLADISARSARLAASLRSRPTARANPADEAAQAARSAVGGTGAGLSGPDAAVAGWFATEAATRAAERDKCYREYERVQKVINGDQQ